MEIVFGVDNNYVRHMCVTMLSVIESNKGETIVFHVIEYELSSQNRIYIEELIETHNARVYFYDIDIEKLNIFPVGKDTGNPSLSYAAYLRLFIHELLPQTINKVLYLDCDIIVINSIKDLWNKDLQNSSLAAKDDYGQAQESGAKRMEIQDGYKYFNSGVLLLNLQKLRENRFTEKVKVFVSENKHKIKMHDQDILNGLLYKDRIALEEKWNMMCNTDNVVDYSIIHFAGIKPWHIECRHPLKVKYKEYLNQTKWIGTNETHAFTHWQRLKRFVKITYKHIVK